MVGNADCARWRSTALSISCLVGLSACASTPIAQNYEAYLERDVPGLVYYLERGEDWVAEDAAYYLGYLAAPAATKPLLEQLRTADRSPLVYAAIIVALGRIRSEEAVPAILEFLKRAGDPQQRLAVVVSLSSICSPDSRGTLETLSYDADVLVSRTAKAGILHCWPEGGTP